MNATLLVLLCIILFLLVLLYRKNNQIIRDPAITNPASW